MLYLQPGCACRLWVYLGHSTPRKRHKMILSEIASYNDPQCNTAHLFAEAIQKAVSIPFVNMVESSIAKVLMMTENGQSIGNHNCSCLIYYHYHRLFPHNFRYIGISSCTEAWYF